MVDYKNIFSKKYLEELFLKNIQYTNSVGIDRIRMKSFEEKLTENILLIIKKVTNGNYKFSVYKEKLISKGRSKLPRVISIPTIRDRITLRAIFDFLKLSYPDNFVFLHQLVDNLSKLYRLKIYDCFIKFDIKDFYPSIDHKILIKQLKKHIKTKELLTLIQKSISQPTVDIAKKDHDAPNMIGVPQGLSISNILANIYLMPLDKRYRNLKSYKYFRYVDDILILCKSKQLEKIKNKLINDCNKLNLTVHSENKKELSKTYCGEIDKGFEYLGYKFEKHRITVRPSSINKLRISLIKQFTHYKYAKEKNINLLTWTINLKITGCIYKETKFGWLFYFSQIDDLALLFSLDQFMKKLVIRFGLNNSDINFRSFVKSFHEIKKNISQTKYIPNYDKLTLIEKSKILSEVFSIKEAFRTANEINYHFNKRIYKSIKELEKDLARPS